MINEKLLALDGYEKGIMEKGGTEKQNQLATMQ